MQWWAELSDSRRIRPNLSTDPVVKLLPHYSDGCGSCGEYSVQSVIDEFEELTNT